MIDLDFKYRETINELKSQAPFVPDIALILGSGLGDFAESTKIVKTIPTDKLPNYPLSTVKGHKGYIHFSESTHQIYDTNHISFCYHSTIARGSY